ncbi:GNAT family N-acetyltransferase [Microseira sp. BLCC-F43]|jgi:GNAT superfamily N-acetyltransferase|uniref:GNAT family N-acetyltransferase n=1 Tax=Microseira sp. BLCC-F43 TaxID=3153602 RepID=UPI0035B88992
MEATFKPAETSDIDTLLILIQEFYQIEHLKFDNNTCDALINLLNNKSYGGVWLIQHQEETIGYVVLTIGYSLEFHGRDAFIDELYIRSNYWGQGIGTKTLDYMQEVCRSLGIKALHLEVDRVNTKAQEVYHRFGFQDHDRYLLTKWL